MEQFQDVDTLNVSEEWANNETQIINPDQGHIMVKYLKTDNVVLTYLDYICIAWFTGEYFTRLWASPNRWIFIKSPMNIIDVIAFLPFYITLALSVFNLKAKRFDGLRRVIQTFRVMRVLRVLKLARHSTGLQVSIVV